MTNKILVVGALDIIAKLSNPDYLEMALMTKVGLLDGTQ